MKKILTQLFIFSIPFTIIIPFLIFIFDPYSLFKENYSENIGSMNERFVKMRYLVNHKTSFNAFLFGSSRVGNIDTRLIKNEHCYNMTCSGSLPADWLHDLNVLIESKQPIKKIWIGIDDISYLRPNNYNDDILFRRAYEINDIKNYSYYFRYLFRIPKLSELKNAVMGNEKYKKFPIVYNIYENGIPLKESKEEHIEKTKEDHRKQKLFSWNGSHYQLKSNKDECIKTLLEIEKTCVQHHITCVFFINPIYKSKYLTNDPEGFIDFKQSLAKHISFWDFSGINSITSDPYYWFERSHYRMIVGNEMLRKMERLEGADIDPSFGKFVTPHHSDSLLQIESSVLKTYFNN